MDMDTINEWESRFDRIDHKYSKRISQIDLEKKDHKYLRMRSNRHDRKRDKVNLHKQGFIMKQDVRRAIQEAI